MQYLTFDETIQAVRDSWRRFYPADKHGGIICPKCGNGSGQDGTGIRLNKKGTKPGALVCDRVSEDQTQNSAKGGKCCFSGDIIDLLQEDPAQRSCTDFWSTLKYAADFLGIEIINDSERPKTSRRAEGKETDTENEKTPKTAPQSVKRANTELIDYTAYYRECEKTLKEDAEAQRLVQEYCAREGVEPETVTKEKWGVDLNFRSPERVRRGEETWPGPRIIAPILKNQFIAISLDPKAKTKRLNEIGGAEAMTIYKAESLEEGRPVFVTEGPNDAWSIEQAGGTAVALLGASNTNLLIEKLQDLAEQGRPLPPGFILALDNDDPGKIASNKLQADFEKLKIKAVKAVFSGYYKDPKEYWIKDKKALIEDVGRLESEIMNDTTEENRETAAGQETETAGTMLEYIKALPEIVQTQSRKKKAWTGFAGLDAETGGVFPGMYVIAAAPGTGKTTLALQIADFMAADGQTVLYFTLEQSRLELACKSLARINAETGGRRANSAQIRRGEATKEAEKAAAEYIRRGTAANMTIIEGGEDCTADYICNTVRKHAKKAGRAPVVFIDYLQLITPDKYKKTKEGLDAIITQLRRLARELQTTIFAISSYNRTNYTLPADYEALKETGQIEYSAESVWALQYIAVRRFEEKTPAAQKRETLAREAEKTPREVELVILKNRNGKTGGGCGFEYHAEWDLFTEMNPDKYEMTKGPKDRHSKKGY